MSRDTDEAARRLLSTNPHERMLAATNGGDLQAMARLWLRVRRGIDEKVLEQDSGDQYDYLRDLFGIAGVEDGDK